MQFTEWRVNTSQPYNWPFGGNPSVTDGFPPQRANDTGIWCTMHKIQDSNTFIHQNNTIFNMDWYNDNGIETTVESYPCLLFVTVGMVYKTQYQGLIYYTV